MLIMKKTYFEKIIKTNWFPNSNIFISDKLYLDNLYLDNLNLNKKLINFKIDGYSGFTIIYFLYFSYLQKFIELTELKKIFNCI